MIQDGAFQVPVVTQGKEADFAVLAIASENDMQTAWLCDWPELWNRTDFDCEGFVKFQYQGTILGLMRYALYPFPGEPKFIEVRNLEANPANRMVEPVGTWLLWYASQLGLVQCSNSQDETLMFLISLDPAVRYYREKIQMEYLEAVTIAPGEEGHAFRFTKNAAQKFCKRHEQLWGFPCTINQ